MATSLTSFPLREGGDGDGAGGDGSCAAGAVRGVPADSSSMVAISQGKNVRGPVTARRQGRGTRSLGAEGKRCVEHSRVLAWTGAEERGTAPQEAGPGRRSPQSKCATNALSGDTCAT